MVILGGLEVVVGGYLIHRYHKNKNEKKRLEIEANNRRQNTFPGAKPQSYPPQQQPMMPEQKYACYAPQPLPQSQFQPRPHPAQTFPQTRPYPQHSQSHPPPMPQYQPPIQPLQRADSMATLSNMPIANGLRPGEANPQLPPRRQTSNPRPIPQQQHLTTPYYNPSFSTSVPAFQPSPTSPYTHNNSAFGRQTVDDNWEAYGPVSGSPHHGNQEDEDDPPPPYRP